MRICCCCLSTDSKNSNSGSALISQSSTSEHAKLQSLSEHNDRDQSDKRRIGGSPYVKVKSAHVSIAPVTQPPASQLSEPNGYLRHPLQQNTQYRKTADLGTGGSAFVILAEDLHTKQQVAIKFVDRSSSSIKNAGKEVLHQRLCSMHPNIVKFHKVFLTDTHFCIVNEYAPGGDLVDLIEANDALSEDKSRWLFQQVVVAVDYCHQMGIANRDIKLENALLMDSSQRPVLKLCDFGYSKDELYASMCKTVCGTPEYVAPEVLLYSQYAGKTADVWSCGILLYCMLTGCFPFRRQEDQGLHAQAALQKMLPRVLKADFEVPKGLSTDCVDLLHKLLEVDPEVRITVPQILQHPWFLKGFPAKLAELNTQLLRLPLSLLSESCSQSEEEIAQLAAQAGKVSKKPRQGAMQA